MKRSRQETTPNQIRIMHISTVGVTLLFLRGLPTYLARRNLEFSAISAPDPESEAWARHEGVTVHRVEMARAITPMRDIVSIFRMTTLLQTCAPSVVNAHTPKAGLLGMIASTLARVPVRVYHMHGLPLMTASGVNRRMLWLSEWFSCTLAHQVIAVGPSIRDIAIAEGLCRPDKIKVLSAGTISGIDCDGRFDPDNVDGPSRDQLRNQLGLSSNNFVIGYVGRIVQDKGISELLASFEEISKKHVHARLLIVGPFEERDAIRKNERQEIERNPRILHIDMTLDVHLYYRAMDLFVLPTYREGFPISPMEAASMRLPVIATDIPGCVDAVQDGITGTLVPPRNVESLNRAIDRYIGDPYLRRKHGEAGRERVQRDFRQEVIWEALYQEYARLLRAKNIPKGKETGIAATRFVRNGRLWSRGS